MSHKRPKAKNWEEVDEKIRDNITHMRTLEKEYKEKSGYTKWLTYFAAGSVVYSFCYYKFYLKFQPSQNITPKNLLFLFTPILAHGYILMKCLYDKNAFKEYFKIHIELNRIIKKTTQSSEYK